MAAGQRSSGGWVQAELSLIGLETTCHTRAPATSPSADRADAWAGGLRRRPTAVRTGSTCSEGPARQPESSRGSAADGTGTW